MREKIARARAARSAAFLSMPPAKKQKPAGGSIDSPPMQRALDFGSPPPTVGADGAAKFNENEMEQTWKGSLIKLKSGRFLQFAGVEFDSAKPMKSTVLFRPGATGASAARYSVKVLLDPSARANACNSIILGFLGGTFKADGLTVGQRGEGRGEMSKVAFQW